MPAEARTYGKGSSEMRVLLATYESHGDVETIVGLAVRLQALGAEMHRRAAELVPAAAEGCDALVATGMMGAVRP